MRSSSSPPVSPSSNSLARAVADLAICFLLVSHYSKYGNRRTPMRQRASGSGQQTPLYHGTGSLEFRPPGNFRPAAFQAVAELLQRVQRHVRALVARARDAGDRMVAVARKLALELPDHV